MPKDIHTQDSSQQRASRLLLAMGVIVLLGALAYFGLTLAVNRRTPANPDTHFDAENGISVDYESAVWPVCQMTEDAALGHALQLASGEDSANANYQVVLFQRGDKATYEDFIGQSEADLKAAYGVISPRKVKLQVEGATVTAVRCDIQAYYAVLATITCITPGSAWAELSLDRSQLLLHLLEVGDPEAAIRHVQERYEQPLMEIFES